MAFLPMLLLATVALMIGAIDIYLPCLPYLTKHFETTEFMMQLSVMASPIASAIFSLFWGRYSDTHGRRKPMLLALIFFSIGGIFCAYADSTNSFLIGRFIQSIGGGGLSVLTIVILSDLFHGPRYAKYLALYGAMFPVVFALAPVIGAQLFTRCGWRSNFIFITIASLIFLMLYAIYLPETLKSESTESAKQQSLPKLFNLFFDREFMRHGLGHALPVTISMLFTANAAFIFIDKFQLSPIVYSFVQTIPVFFNFTGAMVYRHHIEKIGLDRSIQIGSIACLVFAILVSLVIGLKLESYIVILCVMSWFMAFLSFTVASCATKAYESKPDDRGLAVAVVTMLRNGIAGIVVLWCGSLFNGTMYPMFGFMGCLSLMIFLILRTKSQHDLQGG